MVIRDYYALVVNKVGRSGHSTDWSAIKFKASSRTTGYIEADFLKFKNGAFLRFYEKLEIDRNGVIHRPSYSYHYEGPADKGAFYLGAVPLTSQRDIANIFATNYTNYTNFCFNIRVNS